MEMPLSPEMLGRVFNGAGDPIDGLGEIYPEQRMNINGAPVSYTHLDVYKRQMDRLLP